LKAAVLTAPRRLSVQRLPKPRPGAGQVLVKLKYCGICTLEQRLYTGETRIRYPIIPGHEAAGVVEEVGEEVQGPLKPGVPVALDLVNRCGECYYCRTGASQLCLNRFGDGLDVLGGFAEYRAVSTRQAFPLAEALPLQEAAFAEPLACCIRSLSKLGVGLAEDLLIIGAGPMGLMHLLLGHCLGARVFVSDPDGRRLARARELGAFLAVNPEAEDLVAAIREHTEGRGAEACVVTSPAERALEAGLAALAGNGRLNIFTSYGEPLPLKVDANTVHGDGILITGTEGRTESDFLRAVRLLCFGKVKVASLISRLVPLAEAEEGMRAAMSPETYRVLLAHEG
jgi:L-iditol 2-dehydrogenase